LQIQRLVSTTLGYKNFFPTTQTVKQIKLFMEQKHLLMWKICDNKNDWL